MPAFDRVAAERIARLAVIDQEREANSAKIQEAADRFLDALKDVIGTDTKRGRQIALVGTKVEEARLWAMEALRLQTQDAIAAAERGM